MLLEHGDSLDDIFVVLLHVLFDNRFDVLLAPELGSVSSPVFNQSCDLFVLHAGLPVECVHGSGGLKILVPGEIIIRAKCVDGGTQDFVFDPVGDHAVVDVLGEVLVEHVVHAHALEISKGLLVFLPIRLLLVINLGRTGEISLPFGLTEECLPEMSELLAGVPSVSVGPVKVSGPDMDLVLKRALHEVLFNDILGTFLAPESRPPVLELSANDGELSDLTALLHVVRAEFHGELEVLLPAFLIVLGEILDGLVPFDGKLVIILHALLELMAHVQIEGGVNEARIEVGNFVSLTGEESS